MDTKKNFSEEHTLNGKYEQKRPGRADREAAHIF